MRLQGKKIALFVHQDYEDIELHYPLLRMREEGAEVTVVGPERGRSYTGKHGLMVTADAGIEEARVDDFDALIIPGGYSPDHMRRVPAMVDFVRGMGGQHKMVAAICHGPWMLASAGLAGGRRLTSFFSLRDDMVNAGAQWVDEEVVQDGNVITSRYPGDLPAFCRTFIDALAPVGAGAR